MDNRYKLIVPEAEKDPSLIERVADDLSELIDAGILSAFHQINLHGRPAFTVAYVKAGSPQ